MKISFSLIAALLASPAAAQDYAKAMASLEQASKLGAILAGEKLCDLKLDPAAVEAWVTANVDAEDMSFSTNLQMQTMGSEALAAGQTESQRKAHCAAVSKSAQHYGFIAP